MQECACIDGCDGGRPDGTRARRTRPGATASGSAIALGVTLATAVLGAVGALLTGSLALLADLGHLLTDAGALAAALVASVLAARPSTMRRTYGLGRVEVLVAGVNALALVAVVVWVAVEGVARLVEPAEVPGLPLLVIGAAGPGRQRRLARRAGRRRPRAT